MSIRSFVQELASQSVIKGFNPDQERDEKGRFGPGDASDAANSASSSARDASLHQNTILDSHIGDRTFDSGSNAQYLEAKEKATAAHHQAALAHDRAARANQKAGNSSKAQEHKEKASYHHAVVANNLVGTPRQGQRHP